jgi:hypothetical protein
MLRMAKRRRSSGRVSEIRFDENLDGLFAGVDLNTDTRVAKVHLVASSVLSSNDGVGHCSLFVSESPEISGAMMASWASRGVSGVAKDAVCLSSLGSAHPALATSRHGGHDRMVSGGSRKRCMKTRSSQRPTLCPTSLKMGDAPRHGWVLVHNQVN